MSAPRWGMVIDLRRCIGCSACKETCIQFNDVPRGSQWRRVIKKGLAKGPHRRLFLSMGCMQCNVPSCVKVCPTEATKKRSDGIVTIDPDRCIGCGACILACPYRARSIAVDQPVPPLNQTPDIRSATIGTCTKCDFCLGRIGSRLEKDLIPGIDENATPICVWNCIGETLHFGDLNDPDSNVSILIRDNPHIQLNQSSGNDPAVYYIPMDAEELETHEHGQYYS